MKRSHGLKFVEYPVGTWKNAQGCQRAVCLSRREMQEEGGHDSCPQDVPGDHTVCGLVGFSLEALHTFTTETAS